MYDHIDGDGRQPLPPRTGTETSMGSNDNGRSRAERIDRNFMDDDADDMRNLDGWEVLRPAR